MSQGDLRHNCSAAAVKAPQYVQIAKQFGMEESIEDLITGRPMRTHIHKHIHTYTHTYIHTHTHAHTHTYIYTYIHTYILHTHTITQTI